MKRYIILLLTLGIAFSFPAIALAQKVGSLTVVQGTVDLIPAGKAAHAAKPGEPVQVGDTVRTRKEGRAEITFDDGTIIRVARSTEMAINQFLIGDKRTDAQINLPRGKIQSVVPKKVGQLFGQQEANRFEVKTPTATCGVRGTDFFTYHQDGISGATFKEGQGYFFNNKTPDQVSTIVAGQTGTISGPEGKPVVREATKEEMQGHSKDTGASNGKNSDSGGDKSAKSEGGDKDAAGGSEGQKDSKDKGKDDAPLAYTPPPPPPVDEGPKNIGPADNRNIQINIDKKITDSDTTAPVITINSAIAGDDATFGVSINEATKQLTYYLDGQKTTATTFDELADGVHTFMVEAKDLAGNVSTQSYSWTIAADIVVDSGVKPALGVDESGNNFLKLTPQGTVTAFDFTLASEGPMANDTATESVTLSLPWDTTYSLSLTYDDAPPDTVFTTETFYTDYWNSFSSGTLGDYPYGYAEGTLAIAHDQNWGGWRFLVDYRGTADQNDWSNIAAGGYIENDGDGDYWFMELSGENGNGTSELTYLTSRRIGHGSGTSTAEFIGEDTWRITDVATGTLTDQALAFGGEMYSEGLGAGLFDLYNNAIIGSISGRLGSAEAPWNAPANVTYLGYYRKDWDTNFPALWSNAFSAYGYDPEFFHNGGEVAGYVGGVWLPDNTVTGRTVGLYLAPDGSGGFMVGNLTGTHRLLVSYEGEEGMFKATGQWQPIQVFSDMSAMVDGPLSWYLNSWTMEAVAIEGTFIKTDGSPQGSLAGQNASFIVGEFPSPAAWVQAFASADGRVLGVFDILIDGTHNAALAPNWQADITASAGGFSASGSVTGAWADGLITGEATGAWVDIEHAVTGVLGGQVKGTFAPNDWQAVTMGVLMDTRTFLDMVDAGKHAELTALNIPNVEIGRTDLSGSNGNITVAMNDVTFFGYRAGESPKIWATGSVNGTYNNVIDVAPVSLSGTGFSNVNFNPTFNQETSKWNATVNGIGTVAATHPIIMSGNAAGTFGDGALTGTASGTSKPE